jgi:hypothetical protein
MLKCAHRYLDFFLIQIRRLGHARLQATPEIPRVYM